jgi:hypothetical protein
MNVLDTVIYRMKRMLKGTAKSTNGTTHERCPDNLEAALLRLRQSRNAYSSLPESEDFTAVAEVEDLFRALQAEGPREGTIRNYASV